MSAYKKLLKNSGVFAIANLGSKIISILLVPYYTYVLTTGEYGTIDTVITSISLILPIITLSIFDATLRFSVKSKYDSKSIFTSSIIVVLIGNVLFLLLFPIINKIPLMKDITYLFYIIVFMQTINVLIAQFARGIGQVKIFAFNGVINTLITVILNIILLSKFNMGIVGYFISMIIAYVLCNLYLIFSLKIWRYISFKKYNPKLVKEMTNYSIPLIPNSLMWWIMNVSDRYIITFFLGVAFNGIYAVANKIPTVLNVLYSIFSQAWQLSAIEESESENKSKFYTEVFKIFSSIMIIGTSFILVVVKPIITTILENEYKSSWRYVPFLLLAVVFTSFSSFLGTNYIAMKDTKGVFKTSMIGAILNIVLNVLLIPSIGLNGAAIATMISFFIVWIIRIYDTKKFVVIKLNIIELVLSFTIIALQMLLLFSNLKYYLITEIVMFAIMLLINWKVILSILNKIMINIKKVK